MNNPNPFDVVLDYEKLWIDAIKKHQKTLMVLEKASAEARDLLEENRKLKAERNIINSVTRTGFLGVPKFPEHANEGTTFFINHDIFLVDLIGKIRHKWGLSDEKKLFNVWMEEIK